MKKPHKIHGRSSDGTVLSSIDKIYASIATNVETYNDYLLILKRAHPSPLANNRLLSDAKFESTTHFIEVNEWINPPINWNLASRETTGIRSSHSDYQPLNVLHSVSENVTLSGATIDFPMNKIHLFNIAFTDGACSGNGKSHAAAGAGVFFGSGSLAGKEMSAPITDRSVCGAYQVTPSNNRGELEAIRMAVAALVEIRSNLPIMIVSDSKYSIGCICEWYPNRVRNNTHLKLANLDLISDILNIIMDNRLKIMFKHVRASHDIKPDLRTEYTRFIYNGNVQADRLAVAAVPRGT